MSTRNFDMGRGASEAFRNAVLVSSFLVWPSFVGHVFQVLDCSVVVDGVSYPRIGRVRQL